MNVYGAVPRCSQPTCGPRHMGWELLLYIINFLNYQLWLKTNDFNLCWNFRVLKTHSYFSKINGKNPH
jgi:hypothetical protein